MNLRKEIESYLPYNCEEEKDKEIMLKYMDTFDDVLTRNNEIGQEAKEGTGSKNVEPLNGNIVSLEIIGVDGHMKKGQYVSSHMHLNITYLLCADESQTLHIKEDENSGVKWFDLDEAVKVSNEPYMKKVYSKLNKKLKDFK